MKRSQTAYSHLRPQARVHGSFLLAHAVPGERRGRPTDQARATEPRRTAGEGEPSSLADAPVLCRAVAGGERSSGDEEPKEITSAKPRNYWHQSLGFLLFLIFRFIFVCFFINGWIFLDIMAVCQMTFRLKIDALIRYRCLSGAWI